MRPADKYPFLATLLKPFLRCQRESLGLVITAIVESSAARSLEIASILSVQLGIRLDSALNRFYRLLRNPRINDLDLVSQVLQLLGQRLGRCALIAIDWTEWHSNLRMLVASEISDRRAIPVMTAAYDRQLMPRSQNSRENTFLRCLENALKRAGRRAIILADRGFRRVSWLSLLVELKLDFVVRLKSDVHVWLDGRSHALHALGLKPGEQRDLGEVSLRKTGSFRTRVLGVWAPGAKEPWFLATNLRSPVHRIVALYDRRMAIEEQLRDCKGCRFGLKLEWTQFKTPEYLARFAALIGVAVLVWTAAGIKATRQTPSLRLHHPTKGPRQSFVTIGMRAIRLGLSLKCSARSLVSHLLAPKLRRFAWLLPQPN